MQQICNASISVYSPQLTVEEMGEKIGLAPTKVIVKGQRRGKSPFLTHSDNIWIFDSRVDKIGDIGEHVNYLCASLEKHAEGFQKLKKSCVIQCGCTIQGNDRPILNISSKAIAFLALIGADLDIDIY